MKTLNQLYDNQHCKLRNVHGLLFFCCKRTIMLFFTAIIHSVVRLAQTSVFCVV